MSQAALATAIGVHQSQVSSHERTGQGIGRRGLLELADQYRQEMLRLGLTVEDLLRNTRARQTKNADPTRRRGKKCRRGVAVRPRGGRTA